VNGEITLTRLIVTGAINWDINLFVTQFPQVGEEVSVRKITRVPGGTAANVSVAAARLLTRGDVAFLGGLGTDALGTSQVQLLEREGVDTSAIKFVDGEASGQAYITIDASGHNCIHTYFGANLRLLPGDLSTPTRLNLIKAAHVIVIMDPPLATAERMAALGKDSEATIIWDPGVYSDLGVKKLAKTLANTDYFILNHLEFQKLLGTHEPRAVGERLAEIRSGLTAIIKQGAAGSTLVTDEGRSCTFFPSIQLAKLGLTVVNTVGCGDAFIGAFAAAKVRGVSDADAVTRATFVGAFKATKQETRGCPTEAELDAFLRTVEA
jgi:ribokinase